MTPAQKTRFQQLRVAFYSEQLELTSAEAEAFWPILHAHDEALEEHRAAMTALQSTAPESDAEARERIETMSLLRKQEVDLDTEFLLKLLPVLGAQRTARIPQLALEFRRSILEAASSRGPATLGPGMRGPRRP